MNNPQSFYQAQPLRSYQPPPEVNRLITLLDKWAGLVTTSADLIELMAAVCVSEHVREATGSPPLWVLLVGQPSSAKTEAISSALKVPITYYLDDLTDRSFISGFTASGTSQPHDLLSKLAGKLLAIKDLSSLFSGRPEVVAKVLGDLAAIFDGWFARFTGTRGKVEYKASFAIVAAITQDALRAHQRLMSRIGSRFLWYRLARLAGAARSETAAMIFLGVDRATKREDLQQAFADVVAPLLIPAVPEFTLTTTQEALLLKLAELLARGRAAISHDRVGSNYELASVQVEEPWRVLQQLLLLVKCLAFVHGRSRISTNHDIELARRIVFSSIPDDRFEMLEQFIGKPNSSISVSDSMAHSGKSGRRTRDILEELRRSGCLRKDRLGRKDVYELEDELKEAFADPLKEIDHLQEISLALIPWSKWLEDE